MINAVECGPVKVVALIASAGGLQAISKVLGDLPPDFPAGVIVQQHLAGSASVLPTILARRSALPVDWADDAQPVTPGRVMVCPPDSHLELAPDGSVSLRSLEKPHQLRFDVLLASLAGCYGPQGVAVVLSGSGRDGAEGVAAMKRAGGLVIAQSAESAAYPSMPEAATEAGADLVLPIDEIGAFLTRIANPTPP